MRIISGIHKGKRFTAPKKLPVRPTTDQAKEALFNILQNRYSLNTLSVLDLFAGIGSISLEFLSRGTTDITAVDRHSGCLKFILQSVEELEMSLMTVKSDVFKFLENTDRSYDIVFVDPPYGLSDQKFKTIVSAVSQHGFLGESGLLIVEHSKRTDFSDHPQLIEERRYGGTVFSFFKAINEL